jgi:hypothetical protein
MADTARCDDGHIPLGADGRELRAVGYPQDVEHAARLDVYDAVPDMEGERLVARGSAATLGHARMEP